MTALVSGLLVDPSAVPRVAGLAEHEVLLVNPSTLECIELDLVGRAMWEAMRDARGDRSLAVATLADRFGVSTDILGRDLDRFVHGLREVGLVVDVGQEIEPTLGTPAHDGAPDATITVTAIVACHDRRELTVRCLTSLFAAVPPDFRLDVVLVDDGSTDGTSEAVRELGLPVTIVNGDGAWYWSRSMAEAERVAERTDPDLLLWLNDDVALDPSALGRLLTSHRAHPGAVVVGAMWWDRASGTTFAGFDWPDRADLMRLRWVEPAREHRTVQGFHGNFVAVPRAARRAVGPIDADWPHQFADLDYALRAGNVGVPIVLMPGFVGECVPSPTPWTARRATPWERAVGVFGRKGWPLRAQLRFHRRHAGGPWRRAVAAFYARAITGAEARRTRPEVGMLLGDLAPEPMTSERLVAALRPVDSPGVVHLRGRSGRHDRDLAVPADAVETADVVVVGAVGADLGTWELADALRRRFGVPIELYDAVERPTALVRRSLRARGGCDARAAIRMVLRRGVRWRRELLGSGTSAATVSIPAAVERTGARRVFVVLDLAGAERTCLRGVYEARDQLTGLVVVCPRRSGLDRQLVELADRLDTHTLVSLRDVALGALEPELGTRATGSRHRSSGESASSAWELGWMRLQPVAGDE